MITSVSETRLFGWPEETRLTPFRFTGPGEAEDFPAITGLDLQVNVVKAYTKTPGEAEIAGIPEIDDGVFVAIEQLRIEGLGCPVKGFKSAKPAARRNLQRVQTLGEPEKPRLEQRPRVAHRAREGRA